MSFIRIFLLLGLFLSPLFSASPLDEDRLILSKVGKDTYRLRVYFNYENPYVVQKTFLGGLAEMSVTLPLPDKHDVQSAKAIIKYTPSIVLHPDRSVMAVLMNDKVIRQFRMVKKRFLDIGSGRIGVELPPKLFDKYNTITTRVYQHYSAGLGPAFQEDNTAPELWSQVDLQNSYIEYTFKHKVFEEKLSSIYNHFFDNKSIIKDRVNFVFPKFPTDEDFSNYGFMANIAGNILKFRDIDFSVSTKINNKRNNVLIATRDQIKEILAPYGDAFANGKEEFEKKFAGNINAIQNPLQTDKGLLVITGDTKDEVRNALYRLANQDLAVMEEQQLSLFKLDIPEASKPYTAPNFAKDGEKIFFSDLGFNTQTFAGEEATALDLNFKIYPDSWYTTSDKIITYLHMVYPDVVRADSVANVHLNDTFAYQMTLEDARKSAFNQKSSNQAFELGYRQMFPAHLLNKGDNKMNVSFHMIPMGGVERSRFNNDLLKMTVVNDSYFILPKTKKKIQMPNLSYLTSSAYPFSIYPDLQKTGILITDFDSRSITAAMYTAFHLGKVIQYPAYRLKVTANINTVIERDLIMVGVNNNKYQTIFANAPVKITDKGLQKEFALDKDFLLNEELSTETDDVRMLKNMATTTSLESGEIKNYLIAQTFRSPFHKKRTILSMSATDGNTLIKGFRKGLVAKHLGSFNGDLWLYNVAKDKSYSYTVKEKYFLETIVQDFKPMEEED